METIRSFPLLVKHVGNSRISGKGSQVGGVDSPGVTVGRLQLLRTSIEQNRLDFENL